MFILHFLGLFIAADAAWQFGKSKTFQFSLHATNNPMHHLSLPKGTYTVSVKSFTAEAWNLSYNLGKSCEETSDGKCGTQLSSTSKIEVAASGEVHFKLDKDENGHDGEVFVTLKKQCNWGKKTEYAKPMYKDDSSSSDDSWGKGGGRYGAKRDYHHHGHGDSSDDHHHKRRKCYLKIALIVGLALCFVMLCCCCVRKARRRGRCGRGRCGRGRCNETNMAKVITEETPGGRVTMVDMKTKGEDISAVVVKYDETEEEMNENSTSGSQEVTSNIV